LRNQWQQVSLVIFVMTGLSLVPKPVGAQEGSVNSPAWTAPAATARIPARATEEARAAQAQVRLYWEAQKNAIQAAYNDAISRQTDAETRLKQAQDQFNVLKSRGAPNESLRTADEAVSKTEEAVRTATAAVVSTRAAMDAAAAAAQSTVPSGELAVNANYLGRAEVAWNSTRLLNQNVGFLPSTIPALGQQFFGAQNQIGVSTGSALVDLSAATPVNVNSHISARVIGAATGGVSQDGSTPIASAFIQQAYAQYNHWAFGITETAFANPSALPDTLDIVGPNARVTALAQGFGTGQARASYTILPPDEYGAGLAWLVSVENPIPEIQASATNFGPPTGANTATYANIPDIITSFHYSDGCLQTADSTTKYLDTWDLQFASLFRDLGYENDTNSVVRNKFGWGESLSGAYRFALNPNIKPRDGVFFCVTYGEGIAHYIVDTSTPSTSLKNVGYDAMLNGGDLVPIPLLAWYASYQHNWGDHWRSNVTYSHVTLDTINPIANPLAYHSGEYVGVNLVYHIDLTVPTVPSTSSSSPTKDHPQQFSAGIEYLYGDKGILDGNFGHDHQIDFVIALSK
jgi:hypothetical protein